MKTKIPLIVAFCVGSLFTASANLILDPSSPGAPGNENTSSIETYVSGLLGTPVVSLLRLDNLALPGAGSPFSVSYVMANPSSGGNANSGATISWNLTGTGVQLLAVYVYGGSQGANVWDVSDAAQKLIGGPTTVYTPVTGGSGKSATISHILFLGTDAPTVPDGGSAIALMGAGLVGLSVLRWRWKTK